MMQVLTPPNGLEIYQSSLLQSYHSLIHAFSTRDGGVSSGGFRSLNLGFSVADAGANVAENRRRFYATLGISAQNIAEGRQVHSANVAVVAEPGIYADTDALVTGTDEIILAIKTADCIPLLLYDPVQAVVGLVHAGWRGVQRGIIPAALRRMQTDFDCKAADCIAVIGPGAQKCCYEIQADVASGFSPAIVEKREGKMYLDLASGIANQLTDWGIYPQNIDKLSLCTICNEDKFYSYRRDADRSGRMMSIIGMRGA